MDKRPSGGVANGKLNDYEILTKLGQGSFGVVYKVKRKSEFLKLLSFKISDLFEYFHFTIKVQ